MLKRLDDTVKLAELHIPGWRWTSLDVFMAGCAHAMPVYLVDRSELPEKVRVEEDARAPFANRILRPVSANILHHIAAFIPPGRHRPIGALDSEIVLGAMDQFEIVRRTVRAYVDQCVVQHDDLLCWGTGQPSETATWDPCAIAILARPPLLATNLSAWARMLVCYLAHDYERGTWKQADLRRRIEASWPQCVAEAAVEKAVLRAANEAYAMSCLNYAVSA